MGLPKKKILENIENLEREGNFHEHANPVDYSKMKKVDGSYKYINKNFFYKCSHYLFRGLLAVIKYPLTFFTFKLKVVGRENLKGIKSAVVTVNHVHDLDCLIAMQGVRGHKLYITIGDFNNFDNALGSCLRCWGTMPLTTSLDAQKNFWSASETILKQNNYILFYPEASLWYTYEKPRPFMNGAYHMASKNNVPIIPMFITFKGTGKFNKQGIERKKATLNIMPAIYPKENVTNKENVTYLRETNYDMCKDLYEKIYNKKLEFSTVENKTKK